MHSGRAVSEASSSRARRRAGGRVDRPVSEDPFALLGLPARPGLSDDDVRAAWRRIAAATHPDREDGGDPARFGTAAGAYVVLRTGFGRGEALADLGLGLGGPADQRGRHAHRRRGPANPAAQEAGRHRARREAPVGRRAGARAPGLNRLRGWIAGRAASDDPANAVRHDRSASPGMASGRAPAHASGEPIGYRSPDHASTHAPWQPIANGPSDQTATRAPWDLITDGSPSETTAHAPWEAITDESPSQATARAQGETIANGLSAGPTAYATGDPFAYGSPADAMAHPSASPVAYGPSAQATAYLSGNPIANGSSAGATAHPPTGWTSSERDARSRPRSWPVGRPGGLAVRVAGAAVVAVVAMVISGWSPGLVGLLAGVLTWLLATAGRAWARRRSH